MWQFSVYRYSIVITVIFGISPKPRIFFPKIFFYFFLLKKKLNKTNIYGKKKIKFTFKKKSENIFSNIWLHEWFYLD